MTTPAEESPPAPAGQEMEFYWPDVSPAAWEAATQGNLVHVKVGGGERYRVDTDEDARRAFGPFTWLLNHTEKGRKVMIGRRPSGETYYMAMNGPKDDVHGMWPRYLKVPNQSELDGLRDTTATEVERAPTGALPATGDDR